MTTGEILDGKYRVLESIGKGGMGAVYSAVRIALGDTVAVKVLLPSQHGEIARARFLREARAAARIRHPSVVQVFDYGGTGDEAPYIVMELLEGPTLAEELAAKGRLPPTRALPIFADVCAAVEAGHRRGVVHRDLKPGNVILSRTDDGGELVKVLDFGIAQLAGHADAMTLTTPGSLVGTCAYMAPEQVAGQETGPSSDVFALGVILYELVTGKLPFDGASAIATMMSIAKGDHAPASNRVPDLPSALVMAIEAALSVDPAKRPASPEALAVLAGARAAPSSGSMRAELPSIVEDEQKQSSTRRASWDATVLDTVAPEMTRVVGRTQELARIEEQRRAAAAGDGKLVVVTGDAGVGKTRLLEVVSKRFADAGGVELRASFFDYEGSRLPSCEAIFRMLGLARPAAETAPPSSRPEGEGEKWRLFSIIAETIAKRARDAPIALVFEDLQWASSLELELCAYLWHTLDSDHVWLLATARTAAPSSDLGRWLSAMANRRAIALVQVAPLSPEEVRAWFVETFGAIRIRPPDLRRIEHTTGRNPHFLVEVVRHLLSSGSIRRDGDGWTCLDLDGVTLPDTVTNIVRAKLDLLPDGVREVLEAAAVIGAELRFATLREACGWEEDALEKALEHALAAQILVELNASGGDDYRFGSETVRRVLYDGMSARRRKRMHQKVAQAIESLYAKDIRRVARLLCYHHHAVGNAREALHWGLVAAEQDLSAHENDGADASLRRARDAARLLTDTGEPAAAMDLARLDRLSGAHFYRLGKQEEAVAHLERAVLATTSEDAWSLHLDARLDLVTALIGRGELVLALAEASRAADIARARNDAGRLLLSESFVGMCMLRTGRLDDARAALEAAIARAESHVPPALLASSLSNLAFIEVKRGAFAEGESRAKRALSLARTSGDPMGQHAALTALAAVYSESGDSASAIPFLEQTLSIARGLSLRRREAIELANLGEAHAELGRVATAQEHFRESLAILIEIQDRACEGDCRVNLGRSLAAEGKLDAAIAMLERGLSICESTGRREYAGLALVSLGEAALRKGDVAAATDRYTRARDMFAAQGAHHLWTAVFGLARAHLAAGRAEQAAELAAVAENELLARRTSMPEGGSRARLDRDLEEVMSFRRSVSAETTAIGEER